MSQQLSSDDYMRLIGHRDGVVTAILKVRQKIAGVRRIYEHTPAWQRRKLARRDAMLNPLLDIEQILVETHASNSASIAHQQTMRAR